MRERKPFVEHKSCLLHTPAVTCSGLSPGGTQAYSSEAQPESSSEMECLWKSDTSFVIIFSSWPGTERTACSSRTHLQWTQIFLWRQGWLWASCLLMVYNTTQSSLNVKRLKGDRRGFCWSVSHGVKTCVRPYFLLSSYNEEKLGNWIKKKKKK